MKKFKNLFLSLIAIFLFELTFAKIATAAACTATNGVYSKSEIQTGLGCGILPEVYEVTIYKIYFCRTEPTTPTTSAAVDLKDCFQVFNNDSGSIARVSQNQSINLTGEYTKPPNGTYTHGYAMMDNTYKLEASLKIDGSMDGQVSGSGVFCRTAEASGDFTSSGATSNRTICSDTEEVAGTYTETLTHLGTLLEAWDPTNIINNINGTSSSIKAILVDENGHLAANEAEVDKVEGFTAFGDPLIIRNNTIDITMNFNVSTAAAVARSGAGDGIYLGVNAFSAMFTTTERKRRRGAWR